MKVGGLRKKYPEFVYKGYSYELKNGDLEISFDFEVPASRAGRSEIKFQAKVVIKNVSQTDLKRVGTAAFNNLIFHLGLAEIPSYWKATASPRILVEAGTLNKQQVNWWYNLFIRGMGQFFYENKIDFQPKNFLVIKSSTSSGDSRIKSMNCFRGRLRNRTLVPIGGGKDAIVTYEILKAAKQNIKPFVLNPKKEQLAILNRAGLPAEFAIWRSKADKEIPLIVYRTLDSKLFELNRKGYLNGHTPFSAYLAFLTTLCATLFGYKYIALSNERSSNEGNVQYLGHSINHQYSKSFEFEKKFRAYSKKYLADNIEYFSFLRPLYELQIAKLFTKYPQYFTTFLSCNEAHKTDSGSKTPTEKWCVKCAKCLFMFASLYPFVEEKQLIKIFGSNLFEDETLIPLMEELVGERNFKPFECVGTTKESLVAFYLSLQKTQLPLPVLLKHFRQHIAKKHPDLPWSAKSILKTWNQKHFLPLQLERVLHRYLD